MNINGDHHFLIYEGKERVVLKSVPFKSNEECMAALLLVKECGGDEENYLRMISPGEEFISCYGLITGENWALPQKQNQWQREIKCFINA